jgi:hypothetical protein
MAAFKLQRLEIFWKINLNEAWNLHKNFDCKTLKNENDNIYSPYNAVKHNNNVDIRYAKGVL